MTRIRLGWESRLDQITLSIDLVVFGAGLVLLGALSGWSGWISVPLIVIGVVFLLVVLLRLQGWRSLRWRKDLVLEPERIVLETRTKAAFRIPWKDLAAVGVHSENTAKQQVLVLFRKTGGLPKRVRVPRGTQVVTALATTAPRDWPRVPPGPWDALVTAPGVDPRTIPVPDPRPAVVVPIGARNRRRGIVGGVLAAAITVGLLTVAFAAASTPATRVLAIVFTMPFAVLALPLLLSAPMAARGRRFVIDAAGFELEDPNGEPFALPWNEIEAISTESAVVGANAVGTFNPGRELDRVLITTRDRTLVVRLGSQFESLREVAAGVQEFAPSRWAGANVRRAGPFELK